MKKVILITGAARRLGKDIATSLSEKGHDIIINYNNSKPEDVENLLKTLGAKGSRVIGVKADISKPTEIKAMFLKISEEFGSLDVLINNAAVFEKVDFFDIDENIFDRFINTNLKSVLFCSIEAAKLMRKGSSFPGRIINIASMGAYLNWQSYIPYSVAKAGVVKLTELMAKRLAPDILVNAIAPGTTITDNDSNQNVHPAEEKNYPMERLAKSSDITSMIEYLVEKNYYITGQVMKIDGGRIL